MSDRDGTKASSDTRVFAVVSTLKCAQPGVQHDAVDRDSRADLGVESTAGAKMQQPMVVTESYWFFFC